MSRHSFRGVVIASIVLALVSGCGGSPPDTGSSATPAGSASATSEPMDLVFISDSSGWGVSDLLAARISAALGRQVRVTDHSIGGLSAAQALAIVKQNPQEFIDAEIIVVGGSAAEAGPVGADVGTCVYLPADAIAPQVYSVADWKDYRAQLDAIYAEIWKVRKGAPVILRTMDMYNPALTEMRALKIEKECTADWTSMSGAIKAAAVANGATMVSIYDAFNGPNHQSDPRLKGLIGGDGVHTTTAGAALIADTLAAAGYATNTPPAT